MLSPQDSAVPSFITGSTQISFPGPLLRIRSPKHVHSSFLLGISESKILSFFTLSVLIVCVRVCVITKMKHFRYEAI